MRQAAWYVAATELLACPRSVRVRAVERKSPEIGIAARQHQSGIGAERKPKEADPGGINRSPVFPVIQDEIKQSDNAGGPGCQNGKAVSLRGIVSIVTRKVDRGDDKSSVCQGLHRVIVLSEPTTASVRDDHEWQVRSCDGTVLRTFNRFNELDSEFAEGHSLRRCCARVPYSASQIGSVSRS